MTTTISVITAGVETQLSSLGAMVSHTGWGMPAVDSYALRAPGQHGDTWGGYALAPRIGGLVFRTKLTDLDALYTLRHTILSLFSPLGSIILKFNTPRGIRYFDCHFYDDAKMNWKVGDWAAQSITVLLKASDPTCYEPAGLSWTFALGGGADSFVVPYVVPYKMGASVINQSQTITYAGNWGTFPLIRITGPITNPVITNSGTGEKLDFTGTTITAGHYYDIDTRYGLKTVKDDAGAYMNSKLVASQLNTFHIGANPEVSGGVNSINVTGSAVTASTKIEVSAYLRDLGV